MKTRGKVIWLYGLSGAGKTTLADFCYDYYIKRTNCIRLDGDVMRNGLNKDLGFSETDREENIRRVSEVARLFSKEGFLVICSFITPKVSLRDLAKHIIGEDILIPVYVQCSLDECIRRDVKGLYQKAVNNEITNFTGIQSPFEYPTNEGLIISTESTVVEESGKQLISILNTYIL